MRARQKPSGPGFTWNIDQNHHHLGERLRRHIDDELKKLRRHLRKFPQDAVHLLITFRKSEAHGTRYVVSLILRIPSNVLRAEASSSHDLQAFTLAVAKLHRQIEGLKSSLRHEREWKRNGRNRPRIADHTQFVNGARPDGIEHLVRSQAERVYPDLLRYVDRRLETESPDLQSEGIFIPPDAVTETADEVMARAMRAPYPPGTPLRDWLHGLADQVIEKTVEDIRRRNGMLSLNEVIPDFRDDECDMITPAVEGADHERETEIASQSNRSPDEEAILDDLRDLVSDLASTWPAAERKLLRLYFFDELEPAEIAAITGETREEVEERIKFMQQLCFFAGFQDD